MTPTILLLFLICIFLAAILITLVGILDILKDIKLLKISM